MRAASTLCNPSTGRALTRAGEAQQRDDVMVRLGLGLQLGARARTGREQGLRSRTFVDQYGKAFL